MNGQAISFYPKARALGVVLPSNSPGVHGLWVPAIALKTPLVLRPGGSEPWTPYRIVQALMKAGAPADAFAYYPSDHAGAGEIVRQCGRSMFFGDVGAVGSFAGDPRIELHGPGYSKVLFGADEADRWQSSLDLLAASVAENGGRSCVNASGVWTPGHGREIAQALAERLVHIEPRAADDPEAAIAPFVDPAVAKRLSDQIDAGLFEPGAEEVTATLRKGPRLVSAHGSTFLLPTVIHCTSSSHPLANREFLFPFVSVVDLTEQEMADAARRSRADARRHGAHTRSGAHRSSAGVGSHRPAESRADPDKHDRLGPAARRESVRSSVRTPGVSKSNG